MSLDLLPASFRIKSHAGELGFQRVGVTSAAPLAYAEYYRRWISEQKHGSMSYLDRRLDERLDPRVYFPQARSVVCVAMNYHFPLDAPGEPAYAGKIARYALGEDYHEVIKAKLFELADWIQREFPGSQTRCGVDTAPIAEKELAARAGVGWMGKNTCILHEETGSWLLLGEVLTNLDLQADAPAIDHCGTCTRCIDACPTHAIEQPYQLDATKCISYQTIEAKEQLPDGMDIAGWIYGCDICQEVCPYNRRAPIALETALSPRFPTGTIDVRQVLKWEAIDYRETLKHSAMKRVKLPKLKESAQRVFEAAGELKSAAGASAPAAEI